MPTKVDLHVYPITRLARRRSNQSALVPSKAAQNRMFTGRMQSLASLGGMPRHIVLPTAEQPVPIPDFNKSPLFQTHPAQTESLIPDLRVVTEICDHLPCCSALDIPKIDLSIPHP